MTASGAKQKPKSKPGKKKQYERFQETARELGVDDDESAKTFESAFKKIVPSRRPSGKK